MNELVTIRGNDCFTNSLVIAEGTHNEHKSVIRIIDTHKKHFERWGKIYFSDFKSTNYLGDLRGRPTKVAFLNEQQATFLITLLRNSEIVLDFKSELVEQFFKMRQILMQRATLDWQETRRIGKLTRRSETDVIKDLIEYAKTQGSKHADRLYQVYSKLANKIVGLKGGERDFATIKQLNTLDDVESMIFHVIKLGMAQCKHYKEIYKDCKHRLDWFLEITFGAQKITA